MSSQTLRIDGLAAKDQPDPTTDPVPLPTADAVKTVDALWPTITVEHRFPNRNDADASQSRLPNAPAPMRGRVATITFPWRVRGSGAAFDSNPVEPTPLYESCGFASAATATDQSFTLQRTGNDKECAVYVWAGGWLFKVLRCRGTWEWPLTPGENQTHVFTIQGIIPEDPATAATPAFTYQAPVPPAMVGSVLTLDQPGAPTPFAPIWDAGSITAGAEVNETSSGNAADGIEDYTIPEFLPEISVTMRNNSTGLLADPYKAARDASEVAFNMRLGPGGDLNSLTAQAACFLRDPEHVDQNRLSAWTATFDVRSTSNNVDGLKLTFT